MYSTIFWSGLIVAIIHFVLSLSKISDLASLHYKIYEISKKFDIKDFITHYSAVVGGSEGQKIRSAVKLINERNETNIWLIYRRIALRIPFITIKNISICVILSVILSALAPSLVLVLLGEDAVTGPILSTIQKTTYYLSLIITFCFAWFNTGKLIMYSVFGDSSLEKDKELFTKDVYRYVKSYSVVKSEEGNDLSTETYLLSEEGSLGFALSIYGGILLLIRKTPIKDRKNNTSKFECIKNEDDNPWIVNGTADIFKDRREKVKKNDTNQLYCSFCYRSSTEVIKMIAQDSDTSKSYICNECAYFCDSAIEMIKCNMLSFAVPKVRCSFCNKEYSDVEVLFANFDNNTYICNECVKFCIEIIEE